MNSKIYFTSNTHFNDDKVFNLSIRQLHFFGIDDMNQELIDRWNKIVSDNDIVYHLGGFGDYQYAEQLNGRIILMFSDYERDQPPSNKQRKLFDQIIERDFILLQGQFQQIKTKNVLLISNPSKKELSPIDSFYLNGRACTYHIIEDNGINIASHMHHYKPLSQFDVELLRRRIIKLNNTPKGLDINDR